MVGLFVLAFSLLIAGSSVSEKMKEKLEEEIVCDGSDKDCFFERFSKLKLTRIDPVKVGISNV